MSNHGKKKDTSLSLLQRHTRYLQLSGTVQGVGFRPFVYRLAQQYQLKGDVKNSSGLVEIYLQGELAHITAFKQALLENPPPLAAPVLLQEQVLQCAAFADFRILKSSINSKADIHLPPDYASCDDCLAELNDPDSHRYHYPFTNCTQCGPRYTIIKALPYDRVNTTLSAFLLCDYCQNEYSNPTDRRFHAQPLACETCGPALSFQRLGKPSITDNQASLAQAVSALNKGEIIALKGIGGYHLLCDACNDAAVAHLRQRKPRPDKPLAVLLPNFASIKHYVDSNKHERQLLQQASRPIVLVNKKAHSPLSALIAPKLKHIGVFLPYSPLHDLLLQQFGKPLVATSGNISGDPVLTDNKAAEQALAHIADAFIHHNRPIQRPADDSVLQVIHGQTQALRLGRGYAPLELDLAVQLKQPVIALGGELKVTVALAWQNRIVISPHICDLGSLAGQAVFEQVFADLQQLYAVKAQLILCDQHPDYHSSRFAKQQPLPVHAIYHHHAHASSVVGDYPQIKNWLCFSWDGTGYGADGSLWGGEAFIGNSGAWQRVATMRPFYLLGGDKAGREPWRSAAALCWETGREFIPNIPVFEYELTKMAWQQHLNAPKSQAVGRIFDALACLVMEQQQSSFEGQAPMQLEALCDDCDDWISLPLKQAGIMLIDWEPLLDLALNPNHSAAYKASVLHNSLAHALIDCALYLQKTHFFQAIALSGGVFQNRYLVKKILAYAKSVNLNVYLPKHVPVNDGGLSYGQVLEYASNNAQ